MLGIGFGTRSAETVQKELAFGRDRANWEQVWITSTHFARSAGTEKVPDVMVVTDGRQRWVEPQGMCGFAWVEFSGRDPFAKWLQTRGLASKGYPKGLHYWVHEYNQSYERKRAYAIELCQQLARYGIVARANSRLD